MERPTLLLTIAGTATLLKAIQRSGLIKFGSISCQKLLIGHSVFLEMMVDSNQSQNNSDTIYKTSILVIKALPPKSQNTNFGTK